MSALLLFDFTVIFGNTWLVTIAEFQSLIKKIYFERDNCRGVDGTFRWLVEEVGELARAIRHQDKKEKEEEFADVFAWLVSLASLTGVDMERACGKYQGGCPRCHSIPCRCSKNEFFEFNRPKV